jgi:KTSC domain-containing protein
MKTSELTPVRSSALKAIGHDGDRLWVLFHSGQIYSYEAPAHHAVDIHKSVNCSQYFLAHIRGKYDHRKEEDAEP